MSTTPKNANLFLTEPYTESEVRRQQSGEAGGLRQASGNVIPPRNPNPDRLRQPLDLAPQEQTRLHTLDFGHDGLERTFRDLLVDADRHNTETGTLPQVVVRDLGDRDVEPTHSILQPPEHRALILQGAGAGEMQFDGEEPDDHRARRSRRFSRA